MTAECKARSKQTSYRLLITECEVISLTFATRQHWGSVEQRLRCWRAKLLLQLGAWRQRCRDLPGSRSCTSWIHRACNGNVGRFREPQSMSPRSCGSPLSYPWRSSTPFSDHKQCHHCSAVTSSFSATSHSESDSILKITRDVLQRLLLLLVGIVLLLSVTSYTCRSRLTWHWQQFHLDLR